MICYISIDIRSSKNKVNAIEVREKYWGILNAGWLEKALLIDC